MKQKLSPAHFRLDISGFVSNIWRADLPEAQSFDDCLDPTFWMHVLDKVAGQNKAQPTGIGDKIAVFKRDAMTLREYMISGIGVGFIKLVEVARAGIGTSPEVTSDSPLQTRWNVGKRGHEVVRSEGEGAIVTVMAGPFLTKPEAVEWINKHMNAMGKAA